jgi:hypothetical protein
MNSRNGFIAPWALATAATVLFLIGCQRSEFQYVEGVITLDGVPVAAWRDSLAVVQAALPDLKASKEGSLLVTNGGLAFADPKIDAMAVQWGSMGRAMVNAAKHKLVGLLAEKLKGQVYVGEVIVLGLVKGTAFDRGQGGLDPKLIGAKFWDLYAARKDVVAQVG